MAEIVADEVVSKPASVRLRPTLAVAAAWGFVAIVSVFRETSASAWPLFCIPTVLAGLLLHVPGALVFGALSVLVVFLATGDPGATAWVGLGAAAVAGVLAGEAAQRWEARERRLASAVVIDPETGACTRAHFKARLGEEIRRCVRYGCSVGALRVSIDGFADLAQKFGARRAHAMLARLAEIVRATIRDTDTVGRVGRHDLGVLLPFASAPECEAVSQRIREAVERARFEGDSVEPAVSVRLSVSSAVFPDEAAGVENVLDLLEQRLASSRDAAADPGVPR